MMKIGIDLTPLQTPHRMRGIGFTLINFMNHLPENKNDINKFVLFVYPPDESTSDPLELIDLKSFNYEVRYINRKKRITKILPGRLNLIVNIANGINDLMDLYFGDSRIKNLNGVNVFLQTDQSQCLPRKFGLKKVVIIYDIIPYVLEWDYLWSYRTARRIHNFSRKASFRCGVRRWLYAHKLKVSLRRADKLLAISQCTKQDFIDSLGEPGEKIEVVPLGVTAPNKLEKDPALYCYKATSWGYIKRPCELKDTKFILFIGGADRRRKLADVVTAFNHLRAEGHELKLVLAGDSMQGPKNIATEETQTSLGQSSYLNDVMFMGFVDDAVRSWLYRNALAFVFPSTYEGFGLPVLEAMSYGTTIICYKNAAIVEVANDAPLYAANAMDMKLKIEGLLSGAIKQNKDQLIGGVEDFSWQKTASGFIEATLSTL